MSSAVFGLGCSISHGAADIPEILSITGPGLSLDPVDVTNQDSTDSYREFIAGLRDSGELSFDINYQPSLALHEGLLTSFNAGTKVAWILLFPGGGTEKFTSQGFISGFDVSAPIDAQLTASVTVKLTGAMTMPT